MPDTQWNVFFADCPSRTSLARIANKWTAMIVIYLATGPRRFGHIKKELTGISAKVLTDTLRALERDGIVNREEFPGIPVRVEYRLTDLGETLIEPLSALRQWAETYAADVMQAQAAYDTKFSQCASTETTGNRQNKTLPHTTI